jgi:hypothetical protein
MKTKGVPACDTTWEDTWISGPFGLKTKGPPVPHVTCHDTWIESDPVVTKGVPSCVNHGMKTVRTSENRLLEQSGSLTVAIAPSIRKGSIVDLAPTVTDVHLDGLGQLFADLLRIGIMGIAQNLIELALRVCFEIHGWTFLRSILPPIATRIMAFETSMRFS